MVVGDLGVVDDAAERQHVEPGHVGGRLRVLLVAAHARGGRLDLADHVGGEEARVGARVGQRLVLLVEALRGGERAAGREAVAVVGLALERGEVVEERRALLLRRRLELGDLAGPGPGRRRRSPRPPRRTRGAAWCPRGSGPRSARPLLARLRLELGVDEPVLLRLELADLDLAAGEDRQRRRLHAAERDGAVEGGAQPDGGGARGVHADDPVGLRARAGGLLEAARSPRPGAVSPKACLIAALVIEDSHSRWTGFFDFAFSYSQAKISSPSRPASQALTTVVDVLAARAPW